MKQRPRLILSVCLNLLLAGVVVWAALTSAGREGRRLISRNVTNRVESARRTTNATMPVVVEVAAPFNWQQVESPDYRVYVKNLRAIGCPEATIRDIIVADINEWFAGRIKDLVDGVTGRFWDFMLNHDELEKLVEEKLKELNALHDEREEMFAKIFGGKDPEAKIREAEQEKEERAQWRQTLDFLPGDKLAQFLEIKDRFSAARQGLKQLGNTITPDERERKSRELNLEEERQINALFTPQELDEYKLRTSSAAGFRLGLADFDATEEELRAIARAKMNQKQAPAQGQADVEIKELFGAERFAAYQRASDDAYRQTLRITDRFDLPPETAVQVYQMQKEAEAQARKIRDDANRPVEERQVILKAMQAETEKSISVVLGSKAFGAYQKYGDGWLSRFAEGVR
jgi:hypothetical protein